MSGGSVATISLFIPFQLIAKNILPLVYKDAYLDDDSLTYVNASGSFSSVTIIRSRIIYNTPYKYLYSFIPSVLDKEHQLHQVL
jgi:hypothetical protein